jgi:hypothetical protein
MADDSQRVKYVYVDSSSRDTALYPSGDAYTLHLTAPLHSVVRVDLVNAKVPNTLYNITDGANIFTFNSIPYSVAPGYYSSCGLADALMNTTGGSALTVTYLADEGRFMFSALDPFTFSANTTELQKALGVATGTLSSALASSSPVYVNDQTYLGQSIYKSTTLVMLNVTEYVFLDIEELRTTSVLDAKKLINGTTDGSTIRSTFGMVPLDVPSGSIKNFKEGSDYKQYLDYDTPIPKLQRLTVRWLNSKGASVNFQGYDLNAFTLRFHCEYKEPPPPTPPLQDVQIQRIVDAMSMVPPPPKPPPERRILGRWVIAVIVIGFVAAYIAYMRLLKPLLERLAAVPPPEPFKPKVSLY